MKKCQKFSLLVEAEEQQQPTYCYIRKTSHANVLISPPLTSHKSEKTKLFSNDDREEISCNQDHKREFPSLGRNADLLKDYYPL